jgi:hypothetical protein
VREKLDLKANLGDDNVRDIFEVFREVLVEHENESENSFGFFENL